ncbi:DUF3761 domain-containing protein [Actinoallomurus sp. CA-150999]|uniref:DUF3761 domain-containing protein n=1 Tax=Actinoallomurus sp. CA-150999 TaxID=3239887 RepID=UPI003D91477F
MTLAAALLLGGCGTTATGAGGVATPSVSPGESTAQAGSPTSGPEPSAPAGSSTPATRTGGARPHPHRPHAPTTHRATVRHHHAAPKAPDHPAGATARCNDGTYSYAAHHQGACSHHGGVAVFYR